MKRRDLGVAIIVLAASGLTTSGPAWACPPAKRVVFDPAGKRHSLPQLTFDARGYVVVGYDGPPTKLVLSAAESHTMRFAGVALGSGGLAATATNGRHIGLVFVDKGDDGKRAQTYFTVVTREGRTLVKRVALGDKGVEHGAPGAALAWNARARQWGALWVEAGKVMFGRLDESGALLGARELTASPAVNPNARLIVAGNGRYAYAMATRSGVSLFVFDDKTTSETVIPAATALEPVAAVAGGTFGVAFRSMRELAFVTVKDGRELRRVVIERLDQPSSAPARPQVAASSGAAAPSAPPTPMRVPEPTLGSLSLAADGNQFVLVWEKGVGGTFDDRLRVARLDANGAVASGYPRRIDDQEIHQGRASIAGTGCDLAVSYTLGDPNGEVKVAVVRAP
jgi:hypothetical protein